MPFTICRNRRRREQMSDCGLRMADVRDPHPPSAMAFTICRKQGAETVVPSWDRRGGCASRKYCEAPLKAQTGWSVQNDHPVRALSKDAFGQYCLMARPPLLFQEGNTLRSDQCGSGNYKKSDSTQDHRYTRPQRFPKHEIDRRFLCGK